MEKKQLVTFELDSSLLERCEELARFHGCAVEKEIPELIRKGIQSSGKHCIVPGCPAASRGRGLCTRHYQAALKLVKEGKTTWEELEKNGKVLPRWAVTKEHEDWLLGTDD